MRASSTTNRAFTMIELLTVIAIIGILAGLLFPAIKSAMRKAETSKAQSAITSLATAFKAYYTEYGKWPISDTTPNDTYIVDVNLVALLQGVNNTALPNPLGLSEPPFTGSGSSVGTANLQGNPRGIHFLEFKQADLDSSGNYVDPWKQPYKCRFDVNYGNLMQNPFETSTTMTITNGFLVWSSGPDGQYDRNGDVPPSLLNKDNVKSW